MKRFNNFIYAIVVFLAGCGGSGTDLSKTGMGDLPEWFVSVPTAENYLYAVATEASKDMQLAVEKATTTARAGIARQLETKLQSLQKQFTEEIGAGENSNLLTQFTTATKTVTNQSLTGATVKSNEVFKDGDTFRAYILVEYPIGEANLALVETLKKNNELYTRFRSSETFEELEKEIQKYEAEKNKK